MASGRCSAWFTHEITRKSLHILICGVPFLAGVSEALIMSLLIGGLVTYAISELYRLSGHDTVQILPLRLIGRTVLFTARRGEEKRFVFGPVTLALGALATLLLFPAVPMSAGIYALAFGDTSATLVGRALGTKRSAEEAAGLSRSKSLAGSLACLIVSGVSVCLVTGDLVVGLAGGTAAALCERVTIPDLDNLIIPLGTALTVSLMTGMV